MGGNTTKSKNNVKRSAKKDPARNNRGDSLDARKGTSSGSYSSDRPKLLEERIPQELQQVLLNIFGQSLASSGEKLHKTVQDVKGYLYDRDFVAAFSTEERRQAYALRWSASRALGYAEIFSSNWTPYTKSSDSESSSTHVEGEPSTTGSKESDPTLCTRPLKVLCLGGGGGAELVAMAAAHSLRAGERKIELVVADVADWKEVVERLGRAVVAPPVLSKYASAAARDSAAPLLNESIYAVTFIQLDALDSDVDWASILPDIDLVTIMFTLNELYSISRLKTTAFLLSLTTHLKSGAELLVVDSPGSYSSVKVGEQQTAANTYRMGLLLDLTLLGKERDDSSWTKTAEDASRWFRLPDGLRYPIELENMRYQIHMYRHQ